MSSDPGAWKKWGALVVFAVQNAGAVLLMRYSKLPKAAPYNNLAAVMMQELVKLVASTVLYAVECGGPGFMVGRLQTDLKENWNEWVQLGVPALLYTLQNVMLFVGAAHLEAAIQQVTYQTKIFFTAIFSVVLLGKKLTTNQWLSLLLLVAGVLCVQGVADMLIGAPPASPPAVAAPSDAAGRSGHVHNLIKKGARRGHQSAPPTGRMLLETATEQVPMVGVGAMLLAAMCSSFASVYFEKMLKGSKKPSLWLRNIQLAAYSSVIAAVSMFGTEDPVRSAGGGILHGFNGVTWAVVMTQSLGGIIVAVCIKYADNILRTFSQTVAVILGAFGSYFLFDFHFTLSFNVGMIFVGVAIVLYGHQAKTPDETFRTCLACCYGSSSEL